MFWAAGGNVAAAQPQPEPGFSHALSLYGDIKYPAGFTQFDYSNTDAALAARTQIRDGVAGGRLRLAAIGTFDSLNPYILKGTPAAGLSLLYDSLMVQSLDEPFTVYGNVASGVRLAPGRGSIDFQLNPAARFHDGTPITPADVVWTFDILRTKGHPFYRVYYADIERAEIVRAAPANKGGGAGGGAGGGIVRFVFKTTQNRELPLIVAQLPVLPRHFYDGKDFAKTSMDMPIGSGPYRVATIDAGRRIVLARDWHYWGNDLPVNKGRYNFGEISYDYYRDATVALQALFAGGYDFRQENIAKEWATAYANKKPVQDGRIVKREIAHSLPTGMQGFVFNLRREQFADARVRQALTLAFDFDWANKNIAYNAYRRTDSYFSNSELAATSLPSADEIKLLAPYRAQVPPQVFTDIYQAPRSDGSGSNRDNLRRALDLLKEAGYALRDGVMVHDKTGKPLTFEILNDSPAFERWVQPWLRNLDKLGVRATLRMVDDAQMQRRQDEFDYDVMVMVYGQSNTPGNEQRDYWQSAKADIKGSKNYMGLKNPVVDALVEKIVNAPDRKTVITATRALDRVLLWGHYMVPHWHINAYRVAYWDKFGMPAQNPPYGLPVLENWWAK